MLLHASIPADEPERVARVVAEIWGGYAMPFPPYPGAFIACSGDERGTVIDVLPRGLEHIPAEGVFAVRTSSAPAQYSTVHLAIGTKLHERAVLAIAEREGWPAQSSDRGGLFTVIEFWLEHTFLLELLTVPEQRRYTASLNSDRFRALLGS